VSRRFWIVHALVPAIGFGLAFVCIQAQAADFRLAHALFYDSATRAWLGANTWWAELVHEGGRELVEWAGLTALLVFVAGMVSPRWPGLRRDAAFVAVAIALSTGAVALLKQVTNVDCPWDLTEFGGTHAFVSLLGQRAPGLPRVECFPGAHSAAGFALVCFYFVLRDTRPHVATLALIGALLTGALFAFAQEARGAHFLSHDLTSGAIVWYLQLALYVLFTRRLVTDARASNYQSAVLEGQLRNRSDD
jgi:membrane-associated PAP2 superfamily phosphatase